MGEVIWEAAWAVVLLWMLCNQKSAPADRPPSNETPEERNARWNRQKAARLRKRRRAGKVGGYLRNAKR